jgi:predicted RNase H-like nuclease (RuvC/YqgF family)
LEEISALQAENTRLKGENVRLKEENSSLNKQVSTLRSDLSNATKVQQRLTRLESKQEEMIQEKVKEKEHAFREEWEEKIRSAKERYVIASSFSAMTSFSQSQCERNVLLTGDGVLCDSIGSTICKDS